MASSTPVCATCGKPMPAPQHIQDAVDNSEDTGSASCPSCSTSTAPQGAGGRPQWQCAGRSKGNGIMSRAVIRWYKKRRGEMYCYAFIYLIGFVLAYIAFRFVLWASLSTTMMGLVAFFAYRIFQRRKHRKYSASWPDVHSKYITTRDGVQLHYQVMGTGPKVMFIANGLGGAVYFWEPVVKHFAPQGWTVVTWDYRGLFESDAPKQQRRLAVPEHAEDVREMLDAIGGSTIDVFVGWSTGVQIGLEFAALYPERVEKLVLVNGSHGQVFATAFQPLLRIPVIHDLLYSVINMLQSNLEAVRRLGSYLYRFEWLPRLFFRVYALIQDNPSLEDFTIRYITDVFGRSPKHTMNYFRMFLELDAHSCYHLLPTIQTPTLIISGYLDVLTPAFVSFEMAAQLPHARHTCFFFGTHFCLAEFPMDVTTEIAQFCDDAVAPTYARLGPNEFRRVHAAPNTTLSLTGKPSRALMQQPKAAQARAASGSDDFSARAQQPEATATTATTAAATGAAEGTNEQE